MFHLRDFSDLPPREVDFKIVADNDVPGRGRCTRYINHEVSSMTCTHNSTQGISVPGKEIALWIFLYQFKGSLGRP